MIYKTFEGINQKKMIFFSFTVGISFSLLLSALTIFDFFKKLQFKIMIGSVVLSFKHLIFIQ